MLGFVSRAWNEILRFVLGPDIFISYGRKDGSRYALRLDEMLRDLELSPYLDQREPIPGRELTAAIRLQLARASSMVLIASEHALKSKYVAEEVKSFLGTGRNRLLVIVAPGRAFATAQERVRNAAQAQRGEGDAELESADRCSEQVPGWLTLLEGIHPATETEDALRAGKPSDDTVELIHQSQKYLRRVERQRRAFWGGLLALALASLAAIGIWIVLGERIEDATGHIAVLRETERQLQAQLTTKAEQARDATTKAEQAAGSASASRKLAEQEKQNAEAAIVAKMTADKERKDAEADAKHAEEGALMSLRQAAAAEQARTDAEATAKEAETLSSVIARSSRARTELNEDPELGLQLALEAANERATPETVAALRLALASYVPSARATAEISAGSAIAFSGQTVIGKADERGLSTFGERTKGTALATHFISALLVPLADDRLLVDAEGPAVFVPETGQLLRLGTRFADVLSRARGENVILLSRSSDSIEAWSARGDGMGTWPLGSIPVAAEPVAGGRAFVALTYSGIHFVQGNYRRFIPMRDVPSNLDANLVVSPRGNRFAFRASDRGIQVWRMPELEHLCTLERPNVTGMTFTPDGKHLAISSWEGLDAQGPDLCQEGFNISRESWSGVEASAVGDKLLAWNSDQAKVWYVSDTSRQLTLGANGEYVNRAAFDATGCRVATANSKGIRVWNVCVERWTAPTVLHGDGMFLADIDRSGRALLTVGDHNTLLRNLDSIGRDRILWRESNEDGRFILSSAFSPDGQRLSFVDGLGHAHLLDVATGKELLPRIPDLQKNKLLALAPIDDGRRFALLRSENLDESLEIVEIGASASPKVLAVHKVASSSRFAVHPTAPVLLVYGDMGVKLWNWLEGTSVPLDALAGSRSLARSPATFSSSGTRLAVANAEGRVFLWRLDGAKLRETAPVRTEPVRGLSDLEFSQDERFMVTASQGRVDVWDSDTGLAVFQIRGRGRAAAAAFSGVREITSVWGTTVRRDTCTPCQSPTELISTAQSRLSARTIADILRQ